MSDGGVLLCYKEFSKNVKIFTVPTFLPLYLRENRCIIRLTRQPQNKL